MSLLSSDLVVNMAQSVALIVFFNKTIWKMFSPHSLIVKVISPPLNDMVVSAYLAVLTYYALKILHSI